MSAALTKKQQKALAFKSKQKDKKRGKGEAEIEDVPEQDLIEEGDDEASTPVVATKTESSDAVESEKKKGKRKKTAWDDEEDAEEGGGGAADGAKPSKKSKKEVQQRFILFVGNLGYKTTKDRVEAVFRQALGETPSVRLLTNKPKPGSTTGPTSRGIAFVEFANSTLLQQALKLHHTNIDGRRINVELTAGGGGSGQARKDKIEARKGRLGEQREKRAEKEKEEGVPEVGSASAVPTASASVGAEEGQVKMRGGRRIKAKPKTADSNARSAQRASTRAPPRGGAHARGGNSGRGSYGTPHGRSKWQPTGANAVSVG